MFTPLRIKPSTARAARSTMTVSAKAGKTELHYFEIRGRMEPIRLLLNLAKADYVDVPINRDEMKNDHDKFPFAQCPRLVDENVDICQSNTITRYLGRKFNMYGKDIVEASKIDEALDGVEALRARHSTLIYQETLQPEALAKYIATHVEPGTMNGRNGGAHWGYLDRLLKKNKGGHGFFVGDKITIADIQLFDLLDIHAPFIGKELAKFYPALLDFHGRIAALPEISAYLKSSRRYPKINNNGLGQ